MCAKAAIEKVCPRCQEKFSCHAADISACDCSKVLLDKQVLTRVRDEYRDCLCMRCLQAEAGHMATGTSNHGGAAGSHVQSRHGLKYLFMFVLGLLLNGLEAQTFPPAAGQIGSTAMHKDSSAFSAWVLNCTVVRGDMDISNPSLGKASAGDDSFGCGKALSNGVVSLGDGGYAVCAFASPIKNGPGPDFAVFENSFDGNFLELAFVEVSSDGINFFRFPAKSLADTMIQAGTFDNSDARMFDNLAGKYMAGYGTPFDLEDLNGTAGLDLGSISHIRVKDVVGCLQDQYCSRDSQGRKINDPWPTPFQQGGFDLDAIGVIHSSAVTGLAASNAVKIYLPTVLHQNEILEIKAASLQALDLLDLQGRLVVHFTEGKMEAGALTPGLYLLRASLPEGVLVQRLLIY